MVPQRPSRRPYPAASPYRTLPTGWRALLIGIAFGFSAGFLFTIGIISLINANNTATIQSPVGNAATSVSITETPTPTPTLTPTPTPIPISTPTPTPTTPGGNGSVTLFRPDEVSFYVIVFLIFLVLSAFVLFRGGGGKK
jgi:hypothetical protein